MLGVVIKIPVEVVEMSEEFIKEAPLFNTEMNMYSRSLIDLDQVLAAVGVRSTLFPKWVATLVKFHLYSLFEILFPRVIYLSHDPPAIVLKDIESESFTDAKAPPETLDDCKVIFKRLAKFHAASYFLTEQVKEFIAENLQFSRVPISAVQRFFALQLFSVPIGCLRGKRFKEHIENLQKLHFHLGGLWKVFGKNWLSNWKCCKDRSKDLQTSAWLQCPESR